MKHIIASLLAVASLLTLNHSASAGDRWCIVDPQHFETVQRDILAEVQFLEEECYWQENLGRHQGFVFAYCTADWDYHEMHYYFHGSVADGHTQYFESDAACLRQLNAYDIKRD